MYVVSPKIPIISSRCKSRIESNFVMLKVNRLQYSNAVLNFGSSRTFVSVIIVGYKNEEQMQGRGMDIVNTK